MVKSKSTRAKKEKKFKFRGAVSRNAAKQSRGAQYGHLSLPKGIGVFREEPKSRVLLDIMPYEVTISNHLDRDDEYEIAVPGALWYKRPYFLHRGIGPNNETIVCPTSAKQKCPICEYRAQLLKDGKDWRDEAVRSLKPSMRNLYVVIPKKNKNYEEVPHIWDVSQFCFQDKLNEEISEDESYETFPDLKEGYSLRIRFSEEQIGSNKYAECSRIDFVPREEPYDESILSEIPHLDEVLVVPSYERVEALFFGGKSLDADNEDEDEDDDDIFEKNLDDLDEEEKEEEEEEEEKEEEEKEEEDEEEEDEEEEEEEEDEEEEEEEVRPTKRKKQELPASKPSKASASAKSSKTKKGSSISTSDKKVKCSYGHKFGKDCDAYEDCDDCEIWEKCMEEQEKNSAPF